MRARVNFIRLAFVVPTVLAAGRAALAMETDQFTTPPAPLHDIGPVLSRKIVDIIESDRTGNDPERVLHEWVGSNIFSSRLAHWVKQIRDAGGPVRFFPNVLDSIFRVAFSPVPASFLFDSPTVNVHGYYLGTDKIDHLFQQGHEYYEQVMRKEAEGADNVKAIAAAVARGVKQEHTYYGTLASGIYSNGRLGRQLRGHEVLPEPSPTRPDRRTGVAAAARTIT